MTQVLEVAATVRKALKDAKIERPKMCTMCSESPLLTPASIADADGRKASLQTRDPNGSKPLARGAMALGVALALGEVAPEAIRQEIIAKDMSLYSSVTSTSPVVNSLIAKCCSLAIPQQAPVTSHWSCHPARRD